MIQFFNQDTPFSIENEQEISSWILSTFHKESITKEIELSIIFCNDDALLEINKQFLNHDYYTDIITFPIEETNTVFEAELYISIDRVKENAQDLSKPFQNELNRVIIHGVLHLCGYGDKTPEEIKIMRLKEDFYIKLTSK
ncbi:MAG: putative rRNA maturation factor [Planctomycetota bacterium]